MNGRWLKRGLIWSPNGSLPWARHSFLQPTPIEYDDSTIRIYGGLRDDKGVSRVGYIDVAADDPSRVLKVCDSPVLDVGEPGMFDENGVVPCAIVRREEGLFLYYAGYQLGQKVRFYVYSGLAVSRNNGETFTRFSRVPITDRSDREPIFRVIHSTRYEDGKWRAWYGAGDSYQKGERKTLPVYNVRYMESNDGVHFPDHGTVVVDVQGDEHRIGRPYVVKEQKQYLMFYGYGSEGLPYKLGCAISSDGIQWERRDDTLNLSLSEKGWDSEMMAYPARVETRCGTYLFYNGNEYGREGFGYAVLEADE
jgi:hypothetical protein